MSAWQPIESAPKDGRAVLLWHNYLRWPSAYRWDDELRAWDSCMGNSVWSEGEQYGPTHWHEMPEPPKP